MMNKMVRVAAIMPLTLLFSCAQAPSHELMVKDAPSRAATNHLQGWQALVWKAGAGKLTVTNTSQSPIHLGRDVKLMPDEMPLTLIKTTLEPGETLPVFGACPEHLPLQKEVFITLSDENAQPGASHRLPINH